MQMTNEVLTKVHIDLPFHWGAGGESLWAEDLGNDLYKIRNVPFFAYGLNFADIVRATVDAADLMPEVREVVQPSGHRTMRVFFESACPEEERADLLEQLKRYEAYFERATASFFAIDIEPSGSYDRVYDQLMEWERSGLLHFETCEARVPGSFDEKPTEH